MMRDTPQLYTVSELNQAIKSLLDSDVRFLLVCVQGELSNYKIYPSGHHYFTLKDSDSSLRCVMFRSNASGLHFRPENGMKVSAVGRVQVYLRDGGYQLYCSELIPDGIGDLQLAFEQLKQRLYREGLFERAHKKALPVFPERIVLVTSPAGAAVHDMIRILRARWPLAKVLIYPVRVQGREAPAEIAAAIVQINRWQCADCIIIGRGGGSLEDLWAFNEECVARAVYASVIPVVSAVGHEPDVTISDFVADVRASTPSNAAEIAAPDQVKIRESVDSRALRLSNAVGEQILRRRRQLDAFQKSRTLTDVSYFVDLRRMGIDRLSDRLNSGFLTAFSGKREKLISSAAALNAMSPMRVLSRGYSVAEDNRKNVLRSVRQITVGERLTLHLCDGKLGCIVENREVLEHGT